MSLNLQSARRAARPEQVRPPAAPIGEVRLEAEGPTFAPATLREFAGTMLPQAEDRAVEGIWAKGDSGVIGGRPKDKKSSIAVELAVSLATGTFRGSKIAASCGSTP